jgi:quinol monooxygenase YgiN
MEPGSPGSAPQERLAVLIRWQAEGLDRAAAQVVAAQTIRRLRHVPGFVDARFFGDFESGTHYYLLTWRDRAAMDAYMASEEMFGIRAIAQPYASGRPERSICSDYSTPVD